MTKKSNAALLEEAAVALEKQSAELKKIRPLARGERLQKAENSLKPATRNGRLREAEHSVAASQPRNSRLVWADMRPAK
ncbi:hypothetical protein [Bradyrhizobium sp. McL0616]|uniref:hypothetical protein n=1 Tax=Bradyrhizobium sp. McL0616 TaxID=3415674 RepID=UPI003CED44E4